MAKVTSYDDIRTALSSQYGVLVDAFGAMDPAGPTDCAGWTVEDLETHVAQTARGLVRIAGLDEDPAQTGPVRTDPVRTGAAPVGAAPAGGLDAWARQLPDLAGELDRLTKSERLSLAPQVKAVERVLLQHGEDKVVEQLTGRHTLKDAALFRLVEAVVHGLDVGIQPDPKALRIVVKELARTLAERHPGRTVELRIPPYTAVQCVEGPRHTRGTPPNVVEAEPVAFVRLCTGREDWADLVRDGRIRASGERSNLSVLVPLLG